MEAALAFLGNTDSVIRPVITVLIIRAGLVAPSVARTADTISTDSFFLMQFKCIKRTHTNCINVAI